MDLESENSALESTGDNDLVCSANPPIGDDVKIEFNGSSLPDDGRDGNSYGNGYPIPSLSFVEIKEDANNLNSEEHDTPKSRSDNSASLHSNRYTSGEHVDGFTVINSAGKGTETDQHIGNSPTSPGMSPSSAVTKGKGLRKWRRIRREVTKDNSTNLDVTKILKRGLANLGNSLEVAVEMKQKSKGSVSSTNAFVNNPVSSDSFSNAGSSSVYKVPGISTFSIGADSENSEDRSSKSSTAASVPKSRHDPSRGSGHSREKHKVKQTGRKHLVNTPQTQRVQQDARQLDAGKKPRGEAENSLSSLESDSRNYCSLFMKGSSSAVNNGHSERLMSSDGEHSDDEQAGEQLSVEGLPTGPSGSVGEGEETSQVDAAVSWQIPKTIKNHKLFGNEDPLIDCAQMLQSVQETLEQEIQKFGELGKEDLRPLDEDLIKATGLPVYSNSAIAELLGAASNWPISEDAFKTNLTSQAQTIEALEKQLEEAKVVLMEKESRITELESTIPEIKSNNENLGRSIDTQQKKYMEMESEMEVLFKQKTEAEIKFVAIADKSITAERQMKLLLAEQKSKEPSKTDKSKSVLLKDEAEEEGISTQKMQSRVSKYFFCFLIQLILFLSIVEFFVSEFLPKSDVVMPT